MKIFITRSSKETQALARKFSTRLKKGGIICLQGDLGSGKTTFAQGLLKGLKVKGPHTSPTFVIMKQYENNVFHIDAYRVTNKDILNLGWEEMIAQKENIIIIEWADRIRKIIPPGATWIKFEWVDENRRKMTFMSS